MKPFIKIHPADKVAVALSPLKKGTEIQLDGQTVILTEDIPQGHKFALTDIAEGESVIKYGNPIGVAKTDIAKGSWIHTHNMKTGLGDLLTYTYNKETTPYFSSTNIPNGIYIAHINEDSPAYSSGIKIGDIITSIDDKTFNNMIELREYIFTKSPGDNITISISRGYITKSDRKSVV